MPSLQKKEQFRNRTKMEKGRHVKAAIQSCKERKGRKDELLGDSLRIETGRGFFKEIMTSPLMTFSSRGQAEGPSLEMLQSISFTSILRFVMVLKEAETRECFMLLCR